MTTDERYERKVNDLLDVMDNLMDVIDEENDALCAHDFETVKELVVRKTTLARLYQERMITVGKHKDKLAALSSQRRKELSEAGVELNELMKDNERLLKANMAANNKLVQAVRNAAIENNTQNSIYGDSGALKNEGDVNPHKNAMNLNKTF